MHELGARLPVECVQITAHEFVSEEILGRYQVPSYAAWYAQADVRSAYRFHRAMLQHLQWRCRRDRWVLKAPSHLPVLDALLDVYPDARIVLTHRDPLKILPSVASILYSTMWVRSDAIDARTDVYALGATLQACLTGSPPFHGGELVGLLRRIAEETPKAPGIDRDLDLIILKCLEKDPESRWPSADALRRALESRTVTGYRPTGQTRAGASPRSKPRTARGRCCCG